MLQITKKKRQIDTMSNSGANEDELMKQLNGIIMSGKVTEEDVQALIESVMKKNRPIQRRRQVIERTKLSK
jgi:hypothetical protein